MTITGTTRLYAILGDPLHKARSPEAFNSLFATHQADAVLIPAEVDRAGFAAAVAGFKSLHNCDGLILTMPHKQSMCAMVDVLRPNARLVGAINAARREPDGRWVGDMFDGLGYVAALRKRGLDPAGKRVHMIGAGAVARAMSFALAAAGIVRLSLRDIDQGHAQTLARQVTAAFPAVQCSATQTDHYDVDILANAAPVGMNADDPLPCATDAIDPLTWVTDVIPKPDITPFLEAARIRGCQVVCGREMVEGQVGLIAEFFGVTNTAKETR